MLQVIRHRKSRKLGKNASKSDEVPNVRIGRRTGHYIQFIEEIMDSLDLNGMIR
jgi:hypothetical protein